ncbi:MAG: hypothetical protein COB22_07905 [Cycloclasticus sp.]|nr:MAG: hypothetical protein COB22_07905 [Cycloclasticus sp.]
MAQPKSDLRGDLNKLVAPAGGKKTSGLADREPRQSIGEHKGSGREQTASDEGSASADITDNIGTLESADGMFAILYNYHSHDA